MRYLSIPCLLLALAACSPSARLPEPVGLSYLAERPIHLDVARIEVVNKYQASAEPPHIEKDLPVPPAVMIQQWVQDRLLPVGKTGHATLTIENASVTESSLKGTPGIRGALTVDQAEKYNATLAVKLEIFDEAGTAKGFAYARAHGSRTVGENYTLGQRRQVWMNMMEKVMNNLDQEMDRNIKGYLNQYTLN